MALQIELLPAFNDNYIFLIHDQGSGKTAAVDPGDAQVVMTALDANGWKLDAIFVTHHHFDHTGGNSKLVQKFHCQVIGFEADSTRIPEITHPVKENQTISLGESTAHIFEVPGHTTGHIAYWFKKDLALFCGDTLFAMGCGRLFEGSAQQMWASLEKLSRLPTNTRVYCAHEYTQANGQFALNIEPGNKDLRTRIENVTQWRRANKPTLPSTIELELKTNPFLRATSPEIRKNLNLNESENWQVFAEIRRRKDQAG